MKHATTAAFKKNKIGGGKKIIRDGRTRITSSEEEMLELFELKLDGDVIGARTSCAVI